MTIEGLHRKASRQLITRDLFTSKHSSVNFSPENTIIILQEYGGKSSQL